MWMRGRGRGLRWLLKGWPILARCVCVLCSWDERVLSWTKLNFFVFFFSFLFSLDCNLIEWDFRFQSRLIGVRYVFVE